MSVYWDVKGKGCRKEVHGLLKSSSKKGQPEMEKSVKFLVAKPSADDSVERFLQLRQKLTSLQALEGTRELENIISVSDNSCNLKSEVRKNRELMGQVRKLKQLEKSQKGLPVEVQVFE
uniref:Uncharacterized protein n=1 Tax=Sphaerodactylus townsendi TaxID=933632 RepID=A0ACB8F3X9_9SAUR